MSTEKPKFTIPQRIVLESLWALCRFVAIIPDFIRHGVFTNLAYVALRLTRYRRKVMMENLRRSFPEKSEKEINKICNKAYYNLAEQILNTIGQAGIDEKEMLHRINLPDAEDVRKVLNGRSGIFLLGHYGPWEAGLAVSLALPELRLVGVYHELKNKVMDELLKRIRQKPNIELVEMKRVMRYFLDNREKFPMAMGLIADQNPTYRSNMPWYKFLHQWTAFFDGGEMIATKYKLPVFYFSPKRIRTGHYVGQFTLIHDGIEPIEQFAITERYVALLEKDIQECPEMWMWTHRRWKHTPPAELLSQKI